MVQINVPMFLYSDVESGSYLGTIGESVAGEWQLYLCLCDGEWTKSIDEWREDRKNDEIDLNNLVNSFREGFI